MAESTQTTRFRFWLWLIRVIGVIAPRRLRANWRREWEAELRHREELLAQWDRLDWRTKLDLLRRSTSAFWDALWLQPKRLEDEMFQDLRFGARMLLKSKGFTMVAVLSLALGIGTNTALFSVVDAVLLKTLPVAEPERLVLFEWQAGLPFRYSDWSGTTYTPGPPGTQGLSLFRYDVFEKMRQARAASPESPLSDFFAFAPIGVTAVVGDQTEIVNGQAVSGGYYYGLRVQPILGRAITDEDDKPGAASVAVISFQFWQERFGANPAVIGQQLKLNKQSFTIIGVTPPTFTGALQVDYHPAVTVPIASEPLLQGADSNMATANHPGYWWLDLMGRLKPGATYEQARESSNGAFQAAALELMPPPSKEDEPAQLDPKDYPRLIAQSGSRGMLDNRRGYEPTIYGLFIVVALVLLIACANVANLLLARATLRGAEISVRLAVGAGRLRLIRQLLTESSLLAALGGAVGVVFAFWGKSVLVALTDKDTGLLPSGVDLSLSWRVLAFTFTVSLLTGVLFGLAPAWRATSQDLATAIKQGRRTTGAVSRLSKGLIVAQVALSLMLLVGAGLFIRTLYNLQKVDLGFNQENLLLFTLEPRQGGYKDERLSQFYQRLFDRLDNLPGVRAATFMRNALIARGAWGGGILLPGQTEIPVGQPITYRQTGRENYFATMETLGPERLYARLLTFFGALALLLAAIGLSGVLAYSAAQRTNEIGIRMALGAQARDILRLVIGQGMKLVLLGLAGGALGGYALKRLLDSQYFASGAWQRQMAERLYGVKATDPLTFTVIASLLTLVALIACWLPARKAAQVDPLDALRHD